MPRSPFGKEGAHYNLFWLKNDDDGMAALRQIFNRGECDPLNFLLLGTSGVHGSYTGLNEIEASTKRYGFEELPDTDEQPLPDDYYHPSVTFVVVHSRLVCMRYGNARIRSQEDIDWLRSVASTTPAAVAQTLADSLR